MCTVGLDCVVAFARVCAACVCLFVSVGVI